MKLTKQSVLLEVKNIIIIIAFSILVGIGLHVFVYNADFAPSGVDGIATILQYVTGINAGYFTFLINLPLLIAAWFVLKKRYVIYTIIYTVIISATLRILPLLNVYQYDCSLPNHSHLISAIFAGIFQGATGMFLKIGGSSGGVDIIGCMIQKKYPHKDVEKIIAYLSYAVVAVSFFIYDNSINSVCLSIVEIFICEKVTGAILRDRRNAVKFEIITNSKNAEEIKNAIIFNLRHSATLLKGQGAFTDSDKEVIICLVSYREIAEFLKIMKNYPDAFTYYSDVMGVHGNFAFNKYDETEEDKLLLQQKINETKNSETNNFS